MNDDQLHDAFAELRRVETARTPPFRMLGRQEQRPYLRFAFAVVLLIVLAIVMVPRRPPAPSISEWKAPTDFLLQTPGRELLASLPDLKGTRQ
jgi:hypothetical protein